MSQSPRHEELRTPGYAGSHAAPTVSHVTATSSTVASRLALAQEITSFNKATQQVTGYVSSTSFSLKNYISRKPIQRQSTIARGGLRRYGLGVGVGGCMYHRKISSL